MADGNATPDRAANRVCYHYRRDSYIEQTGTQTCTHMRCPDCGAHVTAAYGAPLPQLIPLPMRITNA